VLRAVVGIERLVEAWLRSSPARCGINEDDGDEANPMGRRGLESPAGEELLVQVRLLLWSVG